MSWATKVLAVFPAVTGVSTYPLTLAVKGLNVETIAEITYPPVTQVTAKQLIQQIIVERNYEGCAELINTSRWSSLWFICSSKDSSNKPSLYSYNRTRQNKSAIVDQVVSIALNKRDMTLAKVGNEKLRFPPSWMHKWKGKGLIPEQDCNFSEEGQSVGKKSYILRCHGQEIQKGIQFENTNKTKK